MTDFHDQDLSGARFTSVSLNGAVIRGADLRDLRIRGAIMNGARFSGVEICDVEIDAEISNVLVNGVDIAPLVDAELDRRMPERAKMRPTDADGFREAWAVLERLWAETVDKARELPEDDLHRGVGDEWSFIQTLRHLGFASAAWVDRMILGDPSPWHPLDLPWDEAPGWDGIPWDRDARPSLAEVLELRAKRQATVRQTLAGLTGEQLAATVSRGEPGWPDEKDFPVRQCLRIVLKEEWQHRLYAERDLSRL